MLVKCRHCGGENTVHPGQRMLFCSFCGSALAIERPEAPEHLILPHERNDRNAEEALGSYLLSRKRGKPEVTKRLFGYAPYLLVEDEKGATDLVPASDGVETPIPYPPAGNYRFFDESFAGSETVIPLVGSDEELVAGMPPDEPCDTQSGKKRPGAHGKRTGPKTGNLKTVKILHLPLYTLEYKCGRFKGTASIVGGSWHVHLPDLPAEGQAELKSSNLLVLVVLFTAFLFIGKAAPGWMLRFVYILLAAAAGFVFFRIRERMASQS
jgi:hypothetical protein